MWSVGMPHYGQQRTPKNWSAWLYSHTNTDPCSVIILRALMTKLPMSNACNQFFKLNFSFENTHTRAISRVAPGKVDCSVRSKVSVDEVSASSGVVLPAYACAMLYKSAHNTGINRHRFDSRPPEVIQNQKLSIPLFRCILIPLCDANCVQTRKIDGVKVRQFFSTKAAEGKFQNSCIQWSKSTRERLRTMLLFNRRGNKSKKKDFLWVVFGAQQKGFFFRFWKHLIHLFPLTGRYRTLAEAEASVVAPYLRFSLSNQNWEDKVVMLS